MCKLYVVVLKQVPVQKIVTNTRQVSVTSFNNFLRECNEDFPQNDNHICSLSSKTTAFISVKKNHAGYDPVWQYLPPLKRYYDSNLLTPAVTY